MPELVKCEFRKLKLVIFPALLFPIPFTALVLAGSVGNFTGFDAVFGLLVTLGEPVMLPIVLGIVAAMLFFMERDNDTLKNLQTIPISPVKIATAKIVVLFILGFIYSMATLLSAMAGGVLAGSELTDIGGKIGISLITGLLYTAGTLPVVIIIVWLFPAAITLIAGYMIERERADDTLKNILTVPVSFRKLLAGKLLAVGGLAMILALIEFAFAMIVFFLSQYPGFSFMGMVLALVKMLGMNLFVYAAVLPVIIFTGQRTGSFMAGVGFSFFYGFAGTFASGHGLGNIYPITAGLGLISDQGDSPASSHRSLSAVTLLLVSAISLIMVLSAENKITAANIKQKGKKRAAKKGSKK